MTSIGPKELTHDEIIAKLKAELKGLEFQMTRLATISTKGEEAFLRHVVTYETTEKRAILELLNQSGLELLPPNSLDGISLSQALNEVITRMASLGVYLWHTDHLSDAELYHYLYYQGLREETVLFSGASCDAHIIDLLGSGSDDDNMIYLKYYADSEQRRQWMLDWPNDSLPQHEAPPFDRDSSLPQPLLSH